jgi:hypothetical protein
MSDSWDTLANQAAPEAANVLKTLRHEQIEELFESIEKDNQEFADEYAGDDAAARAAHRQRAAIKAIQRFTGTLDEDQRALVRARVGQFHDLSAQWLAHRRIWQANFRKLIEEQPASPDFGRQFSALLVDLNQFDTPDYRAKVLDNQQQVFEMLADLSRTLSARQRSHFSGKIREYISLLEEIGRRAEPASPIRATRASQPGNKAFSNTSLTRRSES